ncbi:superinfection exclusion B family protein [Shewanella sp. KCT]|uniref:superinfection exclusion B family protein n=1 Tax=Shewanella sp. KCT TaxID=2569535 RepID=UPI0011841AA2|nr:superinfection exclusion B family protein [Shewanella sp. KCT]TVP14370.1 hypothetical protein AYI87_11085 [Shewanella sp. KCT]
MFTEAVKSLIEVLKLAPKYLVAVALISGALIFLPESWLELLGLQEMSTQYRAWLGLALLVSVGICIVAVASWIINWVLNIIRQRRIQGFVIDKLNNLTEDEKQILRYYFSKGTRSNTLKVDDGVVQELVACRVIYRSAQLGNMLEGFSHNISDLAWDYIHLNPSILQGSTNTYRTDKRENFW